jgi:type II secretory pathway pseudopilin PulG
MIELLVVMVVSAIIMVGLTDTVVQLIKTEHVASDSMVAIRSLDTAGDWFIRDFESVSGSSLPSSVALTPGTSSLVLTQSISAKNDTTVTYTINSIGQLLRNSSVIASNISQVVYTQSTDTITVTSNIGTVTKTRSYQVTSRVS